jgi:hypothetical protein
MRHRWKGISALLIAAVLGFCWWLRGHPGARPPEPIAATAASPAPAPAINPIAAPKTANTGKKSGQFDAIEVCGVGRVKLDRADIAATDKYFDALISKSRSRWLAALRNSDDYRARATGLYLEGIFDRDSPQKDPDGARDELVQLAVGTKDPAAFALAYSKCIKGEGVSPEGACPQLSLDDWTRADSDNAVPWLQLAAQARRKNDAGAEAAAFAQAAKAHRYETYDWSLFSFARDAIPDDATAAERWMLSVQIIGVEAAMPPPFGPLFQYCSRDSLSNDTVHRQCNALAELMVEKARTLLDLGLGRALGARLSWPAQRLEKLTQEMHAAMQVMSEMTVTDPRQQWSCDAVARGNAYMSQWDELGERGLTKQAIERSGESVAELARKYEEGIKALANQQSSNP